MQYGKNKVLSRFFSNVGYASFFFACINPILETIKSVKAIDAIKIEDITGTTKTAVNGSIGDKINAVIDVKNRK